MTHDPDGDYRGDSRAPTLPELQLEMSSKQLELQQIAVQALLEWMQTMARYTREDRAERQALTDEPPDPWVVEYRQLHRELAAHSSKQTLALDSIAVSMHSLFSLVLAASEAESKSAIEDARSSEEARARAAEQAAFDRNPNPSPF